MFSERAFAVKEFPEQMFAFFFSRGYVQCTEQSFDSRKSLKLAALESPKPWLNWLFLLSSWSVSLLEAPSLKPHQFTKNNGERSNFYKIQPVAVAQRGLTNLRRQS
jgi:hypothetical protein